MESSLHPLAARFGEVADAYERARPGYPDALAELLRARLGAGPHTRALDLGAGTGKLTRTLLATGAQVIAAEPIPEMREQLAAVLPAERILDATAEALPCEDASLDLVAAGDAFHWFEGRRAVAEIARVLRPGGELVLAWHAPFPGERGTWRAELQKLLRDLRGDHPYFVREHGRGVLKGHKAFGTLRNVTVAHHHEVDRGGLVDHVRSISYVASLPGDQWQETMSAVRAIADRAPARISMSYAIDVWITTRR